MFVIYQIEARTTGKDHYKLLAEFDELKEASEYVLDMLEQIVWEAHEKERLFWGVVDSYDGGWDCEEYASKAEALKAGNLSWSRMSKHDQDRRTDFYVGLVNETSDTFTIAKQWK